jgi:PHD/YefM family antitoxin component YafN of YafNO toxin-antitoxin module
MKSFSTGELSRKIGDVTHAASKAPIAITHHSKPRYVMMSVETFMELDPRRAFTTDETPDELAREMIDAMEAYLAESNGENAAA